MVSHPEQKSSLASTTIATDINLRDNYKFYLSHFVVPSKSSNVYADLRIYLRKLLMNHKAGHVYVSPIADRKQSPRNFWIALSKKNDQFMRNIKMMDFDSKFKIINEIVLVTPQIIKQLVTFTLNTRLSLTWHVIGDYLVKGDFLYHRQHSQFHCIKYAVNEKDSGIEINCECFIMKSGGKEILAVNEHESNGCSPMPGLSSFEGYVLPSLKSASIMSRYSYLPNNTMFKTRKDVCNYWKQMYGYELNTTTHNYTMVSFVGNSALLYPSECVLKCRPEFSPLLPNKCSSTSTPITSSNTCTEDNYNPLVLEIVESFVDDLRDAFEMNSFELDFEIETSPLNWPIFGAVTDSTLELSTNSATNSTSVAFNEEFTPPTYLQNKLIGKTRFSPKLSTQSLFDSEVKSRVGKNWDRIVKSRTHSKKFPPISKHLFHRKAVCSETVRSDSTKPNEISVDSFLSNQTNLNTINVDVVMKKLWKRACTASQERKANYFQKYKKSP